MSTRQFASQKRNILLAALVLLTSLAGGQDVAAAPIAMSYFGEIGCSHCDVFVSKTVPEMETRFDVTIEVAAFDILKSTEYARCADRLAESGRPFRTFPVLFIGNNAYQGKSAVGNGIVEELTYYAESGDFRAQVPPTMDGSSPPRKWSLIPSVTEGLRLFPVLLAGLADGINPCAFTTLLFLISMLTLLGRSRRDILIIGIVYTGTIFVTYFLLGFGALVVLRQTTLIQSIRIIMRVLVTVAAIVFAVLSFRDALLLRRGDTSRVMLQLPTRAKQRIHGAIRSGVRSGSLVAGSAVAAFTVSLVELACTGQLYLPTLAYMVQTGSTSWSEVSALGLYNIAFVTPVIILFVAVLLGLRSERVNRWFVHQAPTAKFVTAGVLLFIAGAIWFF